MARKKYPWAKPQVKAHHPITADAVVRGSYSEREYLVEITGDHADGWWIQGRDKDNTLGTGWFCKLGERTGDEIEVLDDRRPDDKVLVLSEPNAPRSEQMELNL